MDDIVRQALLKWPNVPHTYGWLGLDARGHWHLRDAAAQAAGPFPTLQAPSVAAARGSPVRHDKLIEFIERNYACDEAGQWFFQNGPQRVYVELEATPWIWRLAPDQRVSAQSGQPATVRQCVVDEAGRVYLDTALGFGLVHSLDVGLAAEALERQAWPMQEMAAAALPGHFGYVQSPQARQAPRAPGT